MNFLEEQERRLALRKKEEEKASKAFRREGNKRKKQEKLLTRWTPGVTVRNKKTGQTYEYRGLVYDYYSKKQVYLLRVRDGWGQTIQFTQPVSDQMVKVLYG